MDWYDGYDNGLQLLITYPLSAPDSNLSCFKSLDYFNSKFTALQHRILPIYFGASVQLNEFEIAGDDLIVTFTANGMGEYLLNRIGYPVSVSEINDVPPLNALSIGHELDRIIGQSDLKMLYRLPSGTTIWERIRLREVLYSIEYYKVGNSDSSPTMVVLKLLQRGGVKERNKVDKLVSRLDEHLCSADAVDYSLACRSKRDIFLEVRVVV